MLSGALLSPSRCVLVAVYRSGLAQRPLRLVLGGTATIVIQAKCIVLALENVQHSAKGALIGSDETAISFIGATAALKLCLQR